MQTISHPEMVAALVKPGAVIAENITAQEADLWHGATGVAGEATEILDAVANAVLSDNELDLENMIEELGDMEFYLEQVRQNLGISRDITLIYLTDDGAIDLLSDAVGLAIWGGQLLDKAKKVAIYKKDIEASAFVPVLGQIEVFMARLRANVGVNYEQTRAGNISKLSVRYAGLQYSDQAAQARADKTVH